MKTGILLLIAVFTILTYKVHAQTTTPTKQAEVEDLRAMLDLTKPLFINGNVTTKDKGENVAYSCEIFPYTPDVRAGGAIYTKAVNQRNHRVGAYVLNQSIRDIFSYLYGKSYYFDSLMNLWFGTIPRPRCLMQFRNLDSTSYVRTVNGKFDIQKSWSIQLTTTEDLTEAQIKEQMIIALEHHFKLKTFIEKQKRECLVFSRINNKTIPTYTDGDAESMMVRGNKPGKFAMNKFPMEKLIDRLRDFLYFSDYPMVDETGFTGHLGKIAFDTGNDPLTLQNITEHLADFGIRIKKEKRKVDVLVITAAK